jgi:L-cysteine desulfidase
MLGVFCERLSITLAGGQQAAVGAAPGVALQHDGEFTERINQALQQSGWARLDKLYGFLRS